MKSETKSLSNKLFHARVNAALCFIKWVLMIKRSNKQNSASVTRRNLGLDSTAQNDPGFSCQGKVGEFIGLYLRCEVFARKIQHYYQTDKQTQKSKLNTRSLTKELEYFDLHFKLESLLLIYRGGSGKRGNKSARQLRNGYLHELLSADKKEILQVHSEYVKLMDCFLKLRLKT